MSDEELNQLAKQLSEEKERKEKLSEGFDKRKADNVRREEIERQREEQFERERREAEEAAAAAAAAAAARELAQLEQTAISHTQRDTTSDSSVTGSGEELGSSGVTVPTDHTTDGQIAQTNNNNSRSIFDNNESRLQRLQSILSQVNSSLSSASEDFLAERLLTENGRIDMNADLHTASAAAAAAAADTVAPAQAPPLPLPLPLPSLTPAALHHQQQPSDHSSSHIESLTSQISTLLPSERVAATTQPSSTATSTVASRISTAAKCDRNAMLIPRVILQELSQHQTAASLANVDDQFFELSVHDAQTLQRDLREQVRAHQQRALLPRQYIEQRNRELKEDAYKHTVIRFQLPDKTTIQAFFLSKEPVSNVYEFIRSILRDSTKRFDLYFVLNQKITNDKAKHLIDADLAPASTIFLRFYGKIGDEDDYASLFSEKALKYVSLDEADSATKQWLSANSVYQRYDPRVSEESRLAQNVAKRQAEMASDHYESQLSSSTHQQQSSSSSSSHSVSAPKWFKKM